MGMTLAHITTNQCINSEVPQFSPKALVQNLFRNQCID